MNKVETTVTKVTTKIDNGNIYIPDDEIIYELSVATFKVYIWLINNVNVRFSKYKIYKALNMDYRVIYNALNELTVKNFIIIDNNQIKFLKSNHIK